ncbi:MAG: hypothetical protein Q8M20_18065 [Rhodocyclaceae bacterium]|nr:hypothetical protein [Rhodocyclaceae bacterium]
MSTPSLLKIKIKLLALAIDDLEDRLSIRRHCMTDLKTEQCPVVIAMQNNLSDLKRAGREAVFSLLVSGISHREFMKFTKELP